jgi:hypothetical protein
VPTTNALDRDIGVGANAGGVIVVVVGVGPHVIACQPNLGRRRGVNVRLAAPVGISPMSPAELIATSGENSGRGWRERVAVHRQRAMAIEIVAGDAKSC